MIKTLAFLDFFPAFYFSKRRINLLAAKIQLRKTYNHFRSGIGVTSVGYIPYGYVWLSPNTENKIF